MVGNIESRLSHGVNVNPVGLRATRSLVVPIQILRGMGFATLSTACLSKKSTYGAKALLKFTVADSIVIKLLIKVIACSEHITDQQLMEVRKMYMLPPDAQIRFLLTSFVFSILFLSGISSSAPSKALAFQPSSAIIDSCHLGILGTGECKPEQQCCTKHLIVLANMPSRSIRSTGTSKTVKTVDDVFSVLDQDLDPDASLIESRERIRTLTLNNSSLEKDSIDQLHSPLIILAPVCTNSSALLKSMFINNVMLGGVQSTSFFYPVCEFGSAPWDFFCSSKNDVGDKFITDMRQFSGADQVEDITATNGTRVVYFRRNINGSNQPINIRIYVSAEHPIDIILSLPMSYQQSFISAAGAVCFWPRLTGKKLYRTFELNSSRLSFPIGKTKFVSNISKLTKTTLKKPLGFPHIYTAQDNRIEIVTFRNECSFDKDIFKDKVAKLQNLVYAVSDKSTKYLGNTASM